MIELTPLAIADAIGGRYEGPNAASDDDPSRAVIDSREVGSGDLFFGLRGVSVDGGRYAADALAAGAWGVVVAPEFGEQVAAVRGPSQHVFVVEDPLEALGAVAKAWRQRLGAKVIGVTGSTGKTSTKDILAALLAKSRTVVATPANHNTEIGLPLTILGAAIGTDVLVLEMAMRGSGQIDQLARIADPDVGCIVNVGPVHLEQLGTVEAVAAAKAELIAALGPDSAAVMPADEPLLDRHRRDDIQTVNFGPGGDVRLLREDSATSVVQSGLRLQTPAGEVLIKPSFSEHYLLHNLLAAVACAQLVGAPVDGELEVTFSALRGEVLEVLGGVTLINDCYNANPVSMRAALDNLGRARGRKIAVLGGMGELGEDSDRFHHEIASHAVDVDVDLLVAVGELGGAYGDGYPGEIEHVATPQAAAHVIRSVAQPGDTVLVKGSRSVGLESVAEVLLNASHPLGSARVDGEREA
ncbi:MAG: UDP-N-acetylmuramoyl-tripeptide--D-alanyl-D-alanine ligase [Solirubrobacterales bacterium]